MKTEKLYSYTLCSVWICWSVRNSGPTNFSICFDTMQAENEMELGDIEQAMINGRLDKFNNKRLPRSLYCLVSLTERELTKDEEDDLAEYYLSRPPTYDDEQCAWSRSKSYPRVPKLSEDYEVIRPSDEETVSGIIYP